MKAPKNQHQQVLWYLLTFDQVWMSFVINDSMFYKFQTRLSDLELEHGTLTKKDKKQFTNKFGRKSSYTVYSLADRNKALDIYDKV